MRKKRKSFLFLLPSLIGVFLFFVAPFGVVFYYSLVNNPVQHRFVGLANYLRVASNEAYRLAAWNTLRFSLTAVPLAVLLSLTVAVVMEMKLPLKSSFRSCLLSPMMVPVASVILIWQVPASTSMEFSISEARLSLETAQGRERKQQYESSETYKIVSYNCVAKDVKLLEKIHADILIMDEVQRLKNWKTQISMAARKIQSDYAVILSGTPLENRLEELYTVMEFADSFLLSPFWQFKADCILTDGSGKVVGYQNLNKIGEKVSGRLIRRTKKQVALQMPRRMDKNLLVAMTEQQKDMHDELKSQVAQLVLKWRRLHFLPEKDRQKLLILLSQMRMVCDSTFILDQQSRHDTKVDETMDILQPFLEEGDEKVVVFSQWERMTRLIATELDKLHVHYVYLHGGKIEAWGNKYGIVLP